MINTYLVDARGQATTGGGELLAQWRQMPGARIWVDLDDCDQVREEEVFAFFGLHRLAIDDARRPRHPPKLEVFDDHLFILLRGLDADTSSTLEFGTLQLALFAGQDFLVTRHTQKSVSINHWRESSAVSESLRQSGVRLALDIAATAARRYLDLMLEFEPHLTELEDQLQEKPDDRAMRELTLYRTRLRKLRRIFNYHARLFENLRQTGKQPFFDPESRAFRHLVIDVYEKYERLLSLTSMFYELAGDLVEGYISLTNHELNNTIRILTVLTAIFVPLTFLAGVYGMNFEHMPELRWRWGYFGLLGVMLTVMVALLALFRRIRWL